jgi:hypothetical protein
MTVSKIKEEDLILRKTRGGKESVLFFNNELYLCTQCSRITTLRVLHAERSDLVSSIVFNFFGIRRSLVPEFVNWYGPIC